MEGTQHMTQGTENAVQEEDGTLVREKPFVKYEQLIQRAEEEGRISGRYRCLVCGMRFHEKDEADDCCSIVF